MFGYVLLSLIGLLLLVFLFINIPLGRRVVKDQVKNYLTKKLNTRIEIGEIDYSLPKWVNIKNIYLEDQNKDTLLFGEELAVDLSMLKLINGNTDIQKVFLKNIIVKVNRSATDSFFNYQFLVDAFAGNKSTTAIPDTAALKLTLAQLIFNNVSLKFNDQNAGSDFNANIKDLDVLLNTFQPDRLKFFIDDFKANGVDFKMKTYKQKPEIIADKVLVDTSKPNYGFYLSAGKVNLQNVNVVIDNTITGFNYNNKITTLAATGITYNQLQSVATADALLLDSSTINFTQPKTSEANLTAAKNKKNVKAIPWLFEVGALRINNTAVKYDDVNKPKLGGFDVAHLDVTGLNAAISFFKFSTDTTRAAVTQLAFKDKGGFELDSTHANFIFTDTLMAATDVYVKTPNSFIKNNFKLTYDSVASIKLDPQNSLITGTLKNSRIAFNDLYLLVPALKTSFPPAQFANQYVNINTEVRGNLQRLYLPYFQLAGLSGTQLSARGTLYNFTDAKKFTYDLYILSGRLFKKDIFRFLPPEQQLQLANLPAILNVTGQLTGNANNLTARLNSTAADFAFNGTVTLKNIKDPLNLQYAADLQSFTVTRKLIEGFIPPATLAQISLPNQITAAGKISGTTNNLLADLRMKSSYGPLSVKGFMKNVKDPKTVVYDLAITSTGFDVGKLIKQDTVIGKFAGAIQAKGTGFDYLTMRSNIAAQVKGFEFNKYNYSNVSFTSSFNNGAIAVKGESADPNASLNFNLSGNVKGAYPTLAGEVVIDTLLLKPLNFLADTLNLSGRFLVDAKSLVPRQLDASLFAENIKVQLSQGNYVFDTTSLIASSANGIDSIILKAPFAFLNAGGAFDYDKLGTSLQQYVSGYYKLPGLKPVTGIIPTQQIGFNGGVQYHPIVTAFVPELTAYNDILFNGTYRSADTDSALNFNATLPRIVYGTNTISNGAIGVAAKNEKINYLVQFDTLALPAQTLFKTTIAGGADNDSLSVTAHTQDNKAADWFGISGTAAVNGDAYTFRLQDSLLLNYQQWKVAPDNFISYSPAGIIINNFSITSDTARIFITSKTLTPNSPIDVDISNFDLASISALVSGDTVLISGSLNVKATVSEFEKPLPAFTGNASIEGLNFMQTPLGTLNFNASKSSENSVAGALTLVGFGNEVSGNGNYFLRDTSREFDAALNVKSLTLATLAAFSNGALVRPGGTISGNINTSGKFANPRWDGAVRFDTAQLTIAQLGTPYFIDKQTIQLAYPRISLSNFTIQDSLKNKMVIDGTVTANTFTDIGLNLKINAKDFVVVNAKKAVESQIFGYAAIDADVRVSGSAVAPDIEGNILVNNKSDITLVLPEKNYAADEGKEIVRFIDRDTFVINPPVLAFKPAADPRETFGRFLNYNLNIQINKEAAVTIVLDPLTGDEVKVQGDARLNAGVDPGGNIVLAGNYILDKGYYELHYQFLERRFNLLQGSSITFAGEPLDAEVNINAAYTVNTSSRDLLGSEVSATGGALGGLLNQKLPFQVLLSLTGKISKPLISFNILLANEGNNANGDLRSTIDAKLAQLRGDEAATNKQVFSLLLLNRFVGEQSSDFFKGNGGNGFSDIARQSVSQFLSDALNQIAGDLFKGIEIDLNLNAYNDFSSGNAQQRTDLNVALSKTFLNDRVTVSVGNNFGVEGGNQAVKTAAGNTGFKPDISLAYKLTKDGKYLLRAYTKNQFEVTVDGYVVETGVSFLLSMDYEKFNEIFRRKKRSAK